MDMEEIRQRVRAIIAECADLPPVTVVGETQLVGPTAAIKSRALVEALLALEEFAEEHLGVEFDWTSDAAMSQSRSIFRTVDALASHLHKLQGEDAWHPVER